MINIFIDTVIAAVYSVDDFDNFDCDFFRNNKDEVIYLYDGGTIVMFEETTNTPITVHQLNDEFMGIYGPFFPVSGTIEINMDEVD